MSRYPLIAALAVTLFSSTAAAQDHRFEVGAYGGYLFGGSVEGTSGLLQATAEIKSAPSYGAFLDVALRRYTYLELSYTRQPTEISVSVSDGRRARYDMLAQYMQIGGLLEFKASGADWLMPVFGGTLGATVFTADNDGFSYDEWRFSMMFEGGVKIRLTSFLGLRARARFMATLLADNSAMFCASGAGCAFAYAGTAVIQGEVGGGAYLSF